MIKYNFKNRLVFVTASSKGIGFAIANNFYKAGAKVAICSRNKEVLKKAVNEIIIEDDSRIYGFQCDLSNLDDCSQIIDKIETHFKCSVEILINNSGGPPPMLIRDTKINNWNNAINQNLLSSVIISQKVLKSMINKKFGRIIFLTSTAAKEPPENMVLSNVTRAGVSAFSKTLSKELPSNSNITVNTILTGGCKTERLNALIKQVADKNGETIKETYERLEATIPVGYFATPDEFSKSVLYLACEEASYINGISLPLDGGALKGVF